MPPTFRPRTAASSRYLLMSCVAASALIPAEAMAQVVTGFPSAYGIVGTTTGGVTTFGQAAQFAAGNDSYSVVSQGRNRFGDYSATTVDPSNPNRFWTIQEVAQSGTNWQTQIAQFSVGAGNSFNLINSFGGTTLATSNGGWVPPDSTLAAGPSSVVEMVNNRFAVYNKVGSLLSQSSLDNFWKTAGVTPVNFSYDPRLLYDAADGRWIAAAADNAGKSNNFLVGVSNTSDPTAGWKAYSIPVNPTTNFFGDFPTLGINGAGIFLASNNFSGNTAEGSTVLTIDKASLLAGTLNFSRVENQAYSVSGVIPQPTVDQGNGALPEAVLGEFNTPAGLVRRSDIVGPLNAATVTSGPLIAVDAHAAPVAATQPNGVTPLEAGDTRFGSSVVRTAGNDIWAVQTVLDPTFGHDSVRWLDINATTNAVTQQGLIRDAGFSFFYPSVAVNASGQVAIGFSGTASVTSDTLNSFVSAPAAPSASFNMVLAGDQRSNISLLATANDPVVNAFAYVNKNIVGKGNANISVSLNVDGNTVLTFTGDNPVLPSYLFNYGGGPGSPHFGFDGAQGASVIDQYWSFSEEGRQTLPTLTVLGPSLNPDNGSTDTGAGDEDEAGGDVFKLEGPLTPFELVSFATLFADITSDDQTTGTWDEVAFETRTRPTLILTNPTDFTETLSDVGFLLSDTHIPLDSLNFGGEPPPGVPGSMFDLLAKLDGTTLCPNCSVDITLPAPIPEPPVWLMLLGGFAGLVALRQFRPIAAGLARMSPSAGKPRFTG